MSSILSSPEIADIIHEFLFRIRLWGLVEPPFVRVLLLLAMDHNGQDERWLEFPKLPVVDPRNVHATLVHEGIRHRIHLYFRIVDYLWF